MSDDTIIEPVKAKLSKPNMYGRDTVVDEGNPLAKAKVVSLEKTKIHVENLQNTRLITPTELKKFIKAIDDEDDFETRMKYVETEKVSYKFNSSQLIEILEAITSVRTRLAIIESLGPRLIDPRAKMAEILNMFRYSEERTRIEAVLKARSNTLTNSKFVSTLTKESSFRISRPSDASSSNSAVDDSTIRGRAYTSTLYQGRSTNRGPLNRKYSEDSLSIRSATSTLSKNNNATHSFVNYKEEEKSPVIVPTIDELLSFHELELVEEEEQSDDSHKSGDNSDKKNTDNFSQFQPSNVSSITQSTQERPSIDFSISSSSMHQSGMKPRGSVRLSLVRRSTQITQSTKDRLMKYVNEDDPTQRIKTAESSKSIQRNTEVHSSHITPVVSNKGPPNSSIVMPNLKLTSGSNNNPLYNSQLSDMSSTRSYRSQKSARGETSSNPFVKSIYTSLSKEMLDSARSQNSIKSARGLTSDNPFVKTGFGGTSRKSIDITTLPPTSSSKLHSKLQSDTMNSSENVSLDIADLVLKERLKMIKQTSESSAKQLYQQHVLETPSIGLELNTTTTIHEHDGSNSDDEDNEVNGSLSPHNDEYDDANHVSPKRKPGVSTNQSTEGEGGMRDDSLYSVNMNSPEKTPDIHNNQPTKKTGISSIIGNSSNNNSSSITSASNGSSVSHQRPTSRMTNSTGSMSAAIQRPRAQSKNTRRNEKAVDATCSGCTIS